MCRNSSEVHVIWLLTCTITSSRTAEQREKRWGERDVMLRLSAKAECLAGVIERLPNFGRTFTGWPINRFYMYKVRAFRKIKLLCRSNFIACNANDFFLSFYQLIRCFARRRR